MVNQSFTTPLPTKNYQEYPPGNQELPRILGNSWSRGWWNFGSKNYQEFLGIFGRRVNQSSTTPDQELPRILGNFWSGGWSNFGLPPHRPRITKNSWEFSPPTRDYQELPRILLVILGLGVANQSFTTPRPRTTKICFGNFWSGEVGVAKLWFTWPVGRAVVKLCLPHSVKNYQELFGIFAAMFRCIFGAHLFHPCDFDVFLARSFSK